MRIAVSGSTGYLASALIPRLEAAGHGIVRLVRRARPGQLGVVPWDAASGVRNPGLLEGVEAVVHLAGENLAGGLWTPARRARIHDSRVRGTRLVAEALAGLESPPRALLSASAVGFYGNRGSERLDESATNGRGFLAALCRDWEAATEPAREAGVRVTHARLGLVLGANGGVLGKMLPPFRLGLGGRLGDGRQYMSWIALEDTAAACEWLLAPDAPEGPINVVAPHPVTNSEFTQTLAGVLRRPAILPVPGFVLRALLRDLADETMLVSQRAEPRRLLESGFEFRWPTLEAALRRAIERSA